MSLYRNPYDITTLLPDLKQVCLPPSVLSPKVIMPHLERLMRYVQSNQYEGWDLYDGLNSQLFRNMPLYRNEFFRLCLIQFCKRSHINFRKVLITSRGFNPKGGALFLMGYLNLFRHTQQEAYSNEAYLLFQRLRKTKLSREKGWGWGYNFDWQARAFFVPEGTPNLVTSVYVGRALLDYYRHCNDEQALEMALGVSDFILNEMVQSEIENSLCFRYIPGKDTEVHNANLLGAAYLSEILPYQPKQKAAVMIEKIIKSVNFSVSDLNSDGTWPYGTKPYHQWVDNFHTAYNIESMVRISDALNMDDFQPSLDYVIKAYLRYLFNEEGMPKYDTRHLYPIDIHVIAETIVLFNHFREHMTTGADPERITQIEKILKGLVEQFQDKKEGFFYYQMKEKSWNRIPYIRWGQAWMFYALSTCLR